MSRGLLALCFVFVAAAAGCSNEDTTVNSNALEAYIELDSSIDKAMNLAFLGVNTAPTENIDPRTVNGDAKGTLVVRGQVDQGTGSSKTVRVDTIYSGYSDDGAILYATNADAPPLLALELRGVPYGTFSGTFEGMFIMSGALTGPITVELAIDGQLQPTGNTGAVARVPYATHIHGTAVSNYGTYAVDFTR